MRYGRVTMAAAVAALAVAVAACSSSGSSSAPAAPATHSSPAAMTGTETLTAVSSGSAAAANLNSNSNAPLTFPAGVWTGPVAVTVRPFTLPGSGGNGNGPATVTLKTPVGNLVVHHSANQVPGAGNPNQPPPATWTKNGTTCYFITTFSKGTGTWISGTGKFAGAHGTLTYLVTAQGHAPLSAGKTTCGFTTTGAVENSGAQIKFVASGPMTVAG
jgi:hypothetical protein